MEDYSCKFGLPHDLVLIRDTRLAKWERCKICTRVFRWTKGPKGRVENTRYLEAHARNYAQPGGRTNRLYMRLYKPEQCVIHLP